MAAGLVLMLGRQAGPNAHPEYTIGQLCLGVLNTERQVKKAWVLLWSLVWPTTFQEHTGWDPGWTKGGKLALAEGGRPALSPRVTDTWS